MNLCCCFCNAIHTKDEYEKNNYVVCMSPYLGQTWHKTDNKIGTLPPKKSIKNNWDVNTQVFVSKNEM